MASYGTNKGRFDILNRYLAGSGGAADLRMLLANNPPASAAAAYDLNFVSQVTADELTGTGYSRITLANETALENDTTDVGALDADDPSAQTLASNNGTIAGGWVYRQVTNDADSILLVWLDTTDLACNGGNVQVQFAAAGLLTIAG